MKIKIVSLLALGGMLAAGFAAASSKVGESTGGTAEKQGQDRTPAGGTAVPYCDACVKIAQQKAKALQEGQSKKAGQSDTAKDE
jgi:hypothetical protein